MRQGIEVDSSLNRTATSSSLDRSYEYDNVGRLIVSHSGAEARAHVGLGAWGTMNGPYSLGFNYDQWGNMTDRYGWGGEVQLGSPGVSTDMPITYTAKNQRNNFQYDAAGNLRNDLGQTFAYDVTGQQTSASYTGYSLNQSYDGDGLRVKKTENGTTTTYYVRSTVLGGQVVAEIDGSGNWRGYVYQGSRVLALQQSNGVYWMHEDPVTKSKRVTNSSGAIVSTIELDPFGADTSFSSNAAFQPHKYTSYERDGNASDEAMFRRFNRYHSRFDQPDPYDGSYDSTDPQSFNRYSYTQSDPTDFVDPTGLVSQEDDGIDPTKRHMGGWEGALGSGGGFSFLYLGRGGIEGYPNWLIWTFFGFGGPQNPGVTAMQSQRKTPTLNPLPKIKRAWEVIEPLNDKACYNFHNQWWGERTWVVINPFIVAGHGLHCLVTSPPIWRQFSR